MKLEEHFEEGHDFLRVLFALDGNIVGRLISMRADFIDPVFTVWGSIVMLDQVIHVTYERLTGRGARSDGNVH